MSAKETVPEHPPIPPPTPVLAMDDRPCEEHQYAAKVVSGIPKSEAERLIVAAGRYFTAVNVHNPATCKTVTFRWKVTVALPVGAAPGVITSWRKATLRPDESLEIDSPNVHRALGLGVTNFVKGFVVLESPCPLDVVAVYTAATQPPKGTEVLAAFHTERVPGRLIAACRDDLKLDLSTGVAEWRVIAAVSLSGAPLAGIGSPRAANVLEDADRHPVWAIQSGARWVGVRGVAHDLTPPILPGFYTFQTCFSLCSGFESPRIDLKILVDDSATVWLNQHQIGTAGSLSLPQLLNTTNPSFFLPGLNCLSFVVRNQNSVSSGNPVGLNVKATVSALRGACGGCGCAADGAHLVYPSTKVTDVGVDEELGNGAGGT